MSKIFGVWEAIMKTTMSDSMMRAFEEMQMPIDERISKRKKELEENKTLYESLDTFLNTEDKSVFDLEGMEEIADDILSADNFENVKKPDNLIGKIEVIKDRVNHIVQLNELLLSMEEREKELKQS
jgi:hypothetical protein